MVVVGGKEGKRTRDAGGSWVLRRDVSRRGMPYGLSESESESESGSQPNIVIVLCQEEGFRILFSLDIRYIFLILSVMRSRVLSTRI